MANNHSLTEKLRSNQETDKFEMATEIVRLYREKDVPGFKDLITAFKDFKLQALAGQGKSKAEVIQCAYRNIDIASFYADYEHSGKSVFEAEAEQHKQLYHLLPIGPLRAFYHNLSSYYSPLQLRGKMRTLFDNEVYYRDDPQTPGQYKIEDVQRQLVLFRKFNSPSEQEILNMVPVSAVPDPIASKQVLQELLPATAGKKYLQIIFATVPLSTIIEGVSSGKIEDAQWYHAAASTSIAGTPSLLRYLYSFGIPYHSWSNGKEMNSEINNEIQKLPISNAEEVSRIIESARTGFSNYKRFTDLPDVSLEIRARYVQKVLQHFQERKEKKEIEQLAQQYLKMLHAPSKLNN